MEENKKALEVFDLFTSMKKVFGLLRDYSRNEAKNDLEAAILIFIKFHENVNQSMIVERLKVPKQTVSYTICKLEKEGSIKTESDQMDKRQKILKLTEKGEVYANKSLKPLMELHELIYDDLGDSKIEQMKADVEKLNKVIEKETRRSDG